MGKKLTTDEFIEKSKKIHGNKYDYSISNYIGYHKKIKIICKEHGIFEQIVDVHLDGCGCPQCSKYYKIKLTTEEFIKKSRKIHGDRYDYSLSNYINSRTKIKIICKEHGIFEQEPSNHSNGQNCPKCAGKLMNTDYFIEKSNKTHNNIYNYSLVNYINTNTKVKIICPIHGVFEQKPIQHLQGMRCQKCFGGIKITQEQFIKNSKKSHGNKYDYSLVDYKNARTKVKIICKKHGVFEQVPQHHITGVGCPSCCESKGEKFLVDILDKMNIEYEREKRYKECRYKKPLPFDFYLPTYNLCIEYDGEQHFRLYQKFGRLFSLEKQIIKDNILFRQQY